jgi:hypothetical protein
VQVAQREVRAYPRQHLARLDWLADVVDGAGVEGAQLRVEVV